MVYRSIVTVSLKRRLTLKYGKYDARGRGGRSSVPDFIGTVFGKQ